MKKRNSSLTLILAALIIATSIFGMGAALSAAQASNDGLVQNTDEVVTVAPIELEFKIVSAPFELDENIISAQYAAAAAEELIEKAFGDVFTGRVQVDYYGFIGGEEDRIMWFGTAETEKGIAYFSVDARTGEFNSYSYNADLETKASWIERFDAKSEEELNLEKAQSMAYEMELRQNQEPYVMTESDKAAMKKEYKAKANEVLEGIITNAVSPTKDFIGTWINERSESLFDGAKFVSTDIVGRFPLIVAEFVGEDKEGGVGLAKEKNLGIETMHDVTLDNGEHYIIHIMEEGNIVNEIRPIGKLSAIEFWYGEGILDEE